MGCVQLHILQQQYKRTELKVSYRNKELTLKNTVYNKRSDTLVFLVDPLGDTTSIYGKNGGFIGTIFDDLPNQVHFMNFDFDIENGDPEFNLDYFLIYNQSTHKNGEINLLHLWGRIQLKV